MKKGFAAAAIGSVLMTALLAGCAGNASESNNEGSMFEQVSGSDLEQADASEQEPISEQASDNQENVKNEEQNPQADTASSGYDGFKAGTAKAKYTGAGDRTAYLETSLCLEKGKSYTMDEIISALEGATDYKKSSEPTYTMIDCGSDGVQELLVQTSTESLLSALIRMDGPEVMCRLRLTELLCQVVQAEQMFMSGIRLLLMQTESIIFTMDVRKH